MPEDKNTEIVWIVSFEVDEDGSLQSYLIEEQDLSSYRTDIANSLRELIGKGLFYSHSEAEKWAEAQTNSSCGCKGKKGGGCCRK
ncbi:hypothetical protein [Dendrosporobacter sp. 1207_IL3150]|uniref:hypothetical protein n=1 Tax=Dendrosporobacter sp. 1207_IL3150 TaxID=3084054 RepID=UPI002FDAF28E